jgi:hypothetical protein
MDCGGPARNCLDDIVRAHHGNTTPANAPAVARRGGGGGWMLRLLGVSATMDLHAVFVGLIIARAYRDRDEPLGLVLLNRATSAARMSAPQRGRWPSRFLPAHDRDALTLH